MSEPRSPGHALGPWLTRAALGLALAKALLVDLESSGRSLLLGLTVLALTEACVPWRERGPLAQARRGLQAGLLAANALLVGTSSPDSSGERLTLVLGGLVAVATTLALARAAFPDGQRGASPTGQGGPEAVPSSRATRAVRVALATVLTLCVVAVTAGALAPERRVPLTAGPAWRGQDHLAVFSRLTLARLPDEATVLEDGRPLALPFATQDSIAELGSGRSEIVGGRYVHFSSSDGTDPATNGRRYEVAFVPDVFHAAPIVLLFALAAGLALVGASLGAVSLEVPGAPRARAALVLAVVLVGFALEARSWDRLTVTVDTDGYTLHSPTRPPLYPAFLDLFDARPGEPRAPETPGSELALPAHRFLGAVRAQRVLTVLALGALVWEASSLVPVALLALLVWLGGLADLATWGDRAAHANVGSLLADGLNQPLVFLFTALVLAHARRPRLRTGLGLAVVLSLLVLDRPSNTALLVAWPLVFALDARALGVRPAARRALGLALVYALPLLLTSLWTYERHGSFRIHALTGPNVFGTAFELADESDVAALEDPRERELLRLCLDGPTKRLAPDDLGFPDRNIYAIGIPALERTQDPPRGANADFETDDRLLALGKRLIARHPLAYARQVLREIGWLLDEAVLPLLVALGLALVLYRRTGATSLLAYAFLAGLPFVAALPACFFHVPKGRYRSPFGFVECVGVPLLAALIVGLRARAPAPTGARKSP